MCAKTASSAAAARCIAIGSTGPPPRPTPRSNRGSFPVTQGSAYLDWNATAPLRPEVRAAMDAALDRCGNPSSVHRAGRAAKRFLEQARSQLAALAGALPEQVVFTSGGTEANALALGGFPARRGTHPRFARGRGRSGVARSPAGAGQKPGAGLAHARQ